MNLIPLKRKRERTNSVIYFITVCSVIFNNFAYMPWASLDAAPTAHYLHPRIPFIPAAVLIDPNSLCISAETITMFSYMVITSSQHFTALLKSDDIQYLLVTGDRESSDTLHFVYTSAKSQVLTALPPLYSVHSFCSKKSAAWSSKSRHSAGTRISDT